MLERTDLFEVGQEGYLSYRIPALVMTGRGALLAFTSARKAVSDWADIDIMLRRSLDGGRTWASRKIIASWGNATVDNPVAIVSQRTAAVHFLHQVNYARCYYLRSDDEGETFSEPVDITGTFEAFRPEYNWTVIAPGPGHGIQLGNGRLLVSVWLSNGGGKAHRPSCVSTIYSDDEGKTWQRGEIIVDSGETIINPSESALLQLTDGRVMINIRSEAKCYRRLVAYSRDGATGWSRPAFDEALYDPICFASMIRLTKRPEHRKDRILFANLDSGTQTNAIRKFGNRPRENLTVRLSYDEGRTWPVAKVLAPERSGYSDMAVGPDGTIYLLYERGYIPGNDLNTRYLSLARFDLEWLTDGKDTFS